jgi:uncharacterized protein (TIRG00374 family)
MKNKKVINSIFVIIGAVLVTFVFTKVKWSGIDYSEISIKNFSLGIILNLLAYFIHAKRWSYFFEIGKVKYFDLFKIVLAGSFFNTVLPSKAGEVLKPAYLKNLFKVPYFKGLATCLVERVLDTIFVLSLFSLSLLFSKIDQNLNIKTQVITLSLAISILLFSLYIIIRKNEFIKRLSSRLPSKLSSKIMEVTLEIKDGIDISKLSIIKIILFTLMFWFVSIFGFYFLLKSVILPEALFSPLVVITLVGAIGISLSLPSAPANIGIYNYTIYLVLLLFAKQFQLLVDEDLEQQLALVGIMMHLGAIIPDLIFGFIGFASLPNIPLKESSHHNF